MMLCYTLLADGSSDRTLLPILNWLLEQAHPDIHIRAQFATQVPIAGLSLAQRVHTAIHLYPCDVLFVHRDAEKQSHASRVAEIRTQTADIGHPLIPIVPLRMTEAWLLSNEAAIRQAAGNPKGKVQLNLPVAKEWEKLPDPKTVLFDALRQASELSGRRLRQFRPEEARHRVAEIPNDFSALIPLLAFGTLRNAINQLVQVRLATDAAAPLK